MMAQPMTWPTFELGKDGSFSERPLHAVAEGLRRLWK